MTKRTLTPATDHKQIELRVFEDAALRRSNVLYNVELRPDGKTWTATENGRVVTSWREEDAPALGAWLRRVAFDRHAALVAVEGGRGQQRIRSRKGGQKKQAIAEPGKSDLFKKAKKMHKRNPSLSAREIVTRLQARDLRKRKPPSWVIGNPDYWAGLIREEIPATRKRQGRKP